MQVGRCLYPENSADCAAMGAPLFLPPEAAAANIAKATAVESDAMQCAPFVSTLKNHTPLDGGLRSLKRWQPLRLHALCRTRQPICASQALSS